MSTWEERKSIRAKAAIEKEREAEMDAKVAAREVPEAWEFHEFVGHHSHLRGSNVECSCGAWLGMASTVTGLDPEQLSCETCGEVGVVRLPWRRDAP